MNIRLLISHISLLPKIMAYAFILALVSLSSQAQELVVLKLAENSSDLTAKIHSRHDLNGKECGVLKISSPAKIIKAAGNVIGDIKCEGQEYHIYSTHGTKRIDLYFENYNTLPIVFAEYGLQSINSGVTTDIKLVDIVSTDETVLLSTAAVYLKNKQYKAAANMAKSLAEKGNQLAQLILATYYIEGEKDYQKAYKWLELSAEKSTQSQILLGALLIREDRIDEGVKWLDKAANSGDMTAIETLVNIFNNGNGIKGKSYVNPQRAYQYACMGAAKGDKEFQHFVACCCSAGHGVKADAEQAAHWFMLAAIQGKVESQRMLGAMYVKGFANKSPNLAEARKWLKMAALQGDKEALNFLQTIGE